MNRYSVDKWGVSSGVCSLFPQQPPAEPAPTLLNSIFRCSWHMKLNTCSTREGSWQEHAEKGSRVWVHDGQPCRWCGTGVQVDERAHTWDLHHRRCTKLAGQATVRFPCCACCDQQALQAHLDLFQVARQPGKPHASLSHWIGHLKGAGRGAAGCANTVGITKPFGQPKPQGSWKEKVAMEQRR